MVGLPSRSLLFIHFKYLALCEQIQQLHLQKIARVKGTEDRPSLEMTDAHTKCQLAHGSSKPEPLGSGRIASYLKIWALGCESVVSDAGGSLVKVQDALSGTLSRS